MTVERYETIILGGTMLLLVWYISLPYDNVMFGVWQKETTQYTRDGGILKRSLDTTKKSDMYSVDNIIERITEISVYFVVPFVILYKMFVTIKRELRLNVGY